MRGEEGYISGFPHSIPADISKNQWLLRGDLWAFGALKQGCKDNHPHRPPSCGAFTQHVLGGVLGGCCSGILYFNHHLQIRSEIRKSCHTRARKAAAGLGYQYSQSLHIQGFFSFLPAGLTERFFPCDFVIFSRSIGSLLCVCSSH